jgi:membrane protease YdiL (CAAX protease family)
MTEESTGAPESGTLIILAILFEGALAPLAVWLGWLLDVPALGGFAWSLEDATIGAIASVPMLAVFQFGQSWPVGPFRSIKEFFDEEARPILAGCTWPDLALISLAAGVGEEMLFRGVLQGVLSRWLGPGQGWGAASVLFGLLHPITPGYILIAGLMGAYLGGLWMLNGNLLTVMVAHALYDFVALVLLLREKPARSS